MVSQLRVGAEGRPIARGRVLVVCFGLAAMSPSPLASPNSTREYLSLALAHP